jgi:thiamine biosynthesis lipoprotein
MEKIEFSAMGTQMMAALDLVDPRARQIIKQVPIWFEEWEQRFSRFRPDSELCRINHSAGGDIKVSDAMFEVLNAALQVTIDSQGLVTPTILEALETAGYDRSLEYVLADGSSSRFSSSKPDQVDRLDNAITIDPSSRTIHLDEGVRLDLGGIAKGWAADKAARRLRQFGPAIVDAGGDIAVNGSMTDGEPWLIGVTNPFEPDSQQDIDLILLDKGGVATSGRDRRRWERNKIRQHHIIDPRTGKPALTDVLRATVIGPSAQEAEMAAKLVLIHGSGEGLIWLEQHPEFAGLVILEDGELEYSRRWLNFSWR